jgi:hypothetical protein
VNQLLTTAIATYVGNLQASSKDSRVVKQVKPKLLDDAIYRPMALIKNRLLKKSFPNNFSDRFNRKI